MGRSDQCGQNYVSLLKLPVGNTKSGK